MKNKDGRWYHKLACGHIRMISLVKNPVVYGESAVYCRVCDSMQIVLHKATDRFDDRKAS